MNNYHDYYRQRHAVAAICAAPTKGQRRALLAEVPDAHRDGVKRWAIDTLSLLGHWRKKIAAGFPVDKVPEKVRSRL